MQFSDFPGKGANCSSPHFKCAIKMQLPEWKCETAQGKRGDRCHSLQKNTIRLLFANWYKNSLTLCDFMHGYMSFIEPEIWCLWFAEDWNAVICSSLWINNTKLGYNLESLFLVLDEYHFPDLYKFGIVFFYTYGTLKYLIN